MKLTPDLIVFAVIILIGGSFIFRIIKNKGVRGALFGGEVTKTFGEIELAKTGMFNAKLKVHRVKAGGKNGIGIEVINKSLLSYQMVPVTLSREEAVRLAELITRATTDI